MTWLDDREFIDLLLEFPSAKLTPQELVDHMRKLMPRLYSIASSPRVHPQEIHLTVAIVRYETNHRDRVGVCTTFMSDRVTVGVTPTPVFVSHSHFGPPEDTAKDAIMVGPGPASRRSAPSSRTGPPGRQGAQLALLRRPERGTDFLYEEDWKQYQKDGILTRLDTAFSRDQLTKVYVQDRMRENAAELWSWIKGGGLILCLRRCEAHGQGRRHRPP
jgi:sulfite reductase (NADPH) flavoprotein alpha-component